MQGQWIVVDSVPARVMSLLQVGDTFFKGASVRKNLSREGRQLLFDRLEDAVQHGTSIEVVEEVAGQCWRVVVRPVLSPYSEVPVGALGIYLPEGEPIPPRPQVGSMEWIVSPDGQRRSIWDRTMYSIYGMDPLDQGMQTVPPGMWLAKFVSREDQDRLLKIIAEGLEAELSDRGLISYHIVTLHGKSKKLLEMSARKYQGENGTVYLRGLTRQIPATQGSDVLPGEVSAPQSALDAMVELVGDVPLAQVDFRTWQLFQVSPGWTEAGLGDPQTLTLLEMIHDDQRETVREQLEQRAEEAPVGTLEGVRMKSQFGHHQIVNISYRVLPNRYAMVRIQPKEWLVRPPVS
jgi:hypothetical protein